MINLNSFFVAVLLLWAFGANASLVGDFSDVFSVTTAVGYESPVTAASQTLVMSAYSLRTDVYFKRSTNGGVSFAADERLTLATKAYALSLAAATNDISQGTFMLCYVDDKALKVFEYHNNEWFEDIITLDPLEFAASCAVTEGANGKWVLSIMLGDVNEPVSTSKAINRVTYRNMHPSSDKTWAPLKRISKWPADTAPRLYNGHWSGNLMLPRHEMTCTAEGACSQWFWNRMSQGQMKQSLFQVMDDNMQGEPKTWTEFSGFGHGSTSFLTPEYTAHFYYADWGVNCWYVPTPALLEYGGAAANVVPIAGKTCPQVPWRELWSNTDISVSLAVARHNRTGVVTMVMSILSLYNPGVPRYRNTWVVQSFDDCVSWVVAAEDLTTGMNYVDLYNFRNTLAMSGTNWVTTLTSGTKQRAYRLVHSYGPLGMTSHAPKVPPTAAPTASPTLSTSSPSAAPSASTPSPESSIEDEDEEEDGNNDDNKDEDDPNQNGTESTSEQEFAMSVTTGTGAIAGFIAALAFANGVTFALKFGDDMRGFAAYNGQVSANHHHQHQNLVPRG